ncbi:MAG TPA: endonuclease III [Pseudogracilibacillus sp.]|nr:endonuclease III [Pseudogracilibacillus sp.]
MLNKKEIRRSLDVMAKMYPDATIELNFSNPLELVIAVLLSAQTTDINVNRVTPGLFKEFKTPEDYLSVPVEVIEDHIKSIGLFRTKAKNIQKLAQTLIDDFDGEVPRTREGLESLAGVGRKTANVVLSVGFGIPAIAVDTHVERVAKRLAFCRWKDNVRQVEETLMKKIPKEEWSVTHHRLIFFGRYHCKARNPECPSCELLDICREGKKIMKKRQVK